MSGGVICLVACSDIVGGYVKSARHKTDKVMRKAESAATDAAKDLISIICWGRDVKPIRPDIASSVSSLHNPARVLSERIIEAASQDKEIPRDAIRELVRSKAVRPIDIVDQLYDASTRGRQDDSLKYSWKSTSESQVSGGKGSTALSRLTSSNMLVGASRTNLGDTRSRLSDSKPTLPVSRSRKTLAEPRLSDDQGPDGEAVMTGTVSSISELLGGTITGNSDNKLPGVGQLSLADDDMSVADLVADTQSTLMLDVTRPTRRGSRRYSVLGRRDGDGAGMPRVTSRLNVYVEDESDSMLESSRLRFEEACERFAAGREDMKDIHARTMKLCLALRERSDVDKGRAAHDYIRKLRKELTEVSAQLRRSQEDGKRLQRRARDEEVDKMVRGVVGDGRPAKVVSKGPDITLRVGAVEELTGHVHRLEDELREVRSELSATQDEYERRRDSLPGGLSPRIPRPLHLVRCFAKASWMRGMAMKEKEGANVGQKETERIG